MVGAQGRRQHFDKKRALDEEAGLECRIERLEIAEYVIGHRMSGNARDLLQAIEEPLDVSLAREPELLLLVVREVAVCLERRKLQLEQFLEVAAGRRSRRTRAASSR